MRRSQRSLDPLPRRDNGCRRHLPQGNISESNPRADMGKNPLKLKRKRQLRELGINYRNEFTGFFYILKGNNIALTRLDWSKGGQRNISKFFSTMTKKIFLWIYTFQAIVLAIDLFTPIKKNSKFRNFL